jgi:hypothetical protein
MIKHEYKKQEKNLYFPKEEPSLIDVPSMNYLSISGKGNPNSQEFSEKISALYSLSYAIKMSYKNNYPIDGYYEYTVYPLEGVWDLSEDGREKTVLDKNELIYTIMIRQPEFVTEKIFTDLQKKTILKKNIPYLSEVKLEEVHDGKSIQIMHVGSFDDEPRSFQKMKDYLLKNNLKQRSLVHREIYLSNFLKVEKDKLKTVLRYFIE